MKKAIFQTILFFTLFLTTGKADAQPTNCYVQLDEASGFDVSSYQSELNSAACYLAVSFPDSIENQFKVFSFGFYLNLEFYEDYSYPQAFEDMSAAVALQSPYYLLIGKQSDHSGVFTRFWVDLKLPGTGIFSCATEEQLEALKTRLLVAIEYDYFKNGKLAPEFAQAEMKGMEALKEHVLSLYECCDPQNRGVGACDDCASFSTLANFLELAGYSRTEFPNGLAFTLSDADDGFLKQNVEINIIEDGVNHNLNQEVRQFLDSINTFIDPVRVDINMYNSLSCINIFSEPQIEMTDEYLKFKVILAFDDNNVPNLFINSRFNLVENTNRRVLVSLPFEGHGLNLTTLKNELTNFIALGGCNPTVVVKEKLLPLDWTNNDYLIFIGKHAKRKIQNVIMNEYCRVISTGFEEELEKWAKYRGIIRTSDGSLGSYRVAVVDIENINLSLHNLQSSQMAKATAFVAYHELGHMTIPITHGATFSPPGFMDNPAGIYHVLGTAQLPQHPEWFNLYNSLEDLIVDQKNKFGSSSNFYTRVCIGLDQ